jgi:hypothetical protein
VLRRALAAVLVSTIVVAGATTAACARWRGADGGHLWSGSSQLALTHGTRSDLQTLQEVRARGELTAVGLPAFLANARAGVLSPAWLRSLWTRPGASQPPCLVPSNHRPRGPPGLGSSPLEP